MGKISAYLNKLKNESGMTQQQIADLSGVPIGTVPKYFGRLDDDSANFEIVRKLVIAMNGSLDELAGIQPKQVHINEKVLTGEGFTESEIKVILRWAGSEISRNYQAIVAGLEARLSEKDTRITDRTSLMKQEHRRAQEEIIHERKRAQTATIISYVVLGLFVLLFLCDFMLLTVGWIQRYGRALQGMRGLKKR